MGRYAAPVVQLAKYLDVFRLEAYFFAGFPDGRIGSNPGLATPEKGRRFFETSVPELVKTYTSFIGENA